MKKIFLMTAMISTIIYADFTKNNGVVTDSTTALQWQDNETVSKTWTAAIDYCEALSLDGQSDWRLPNLKELISLVDDSKVSPAISAVFDHTASSDYWSSTTYAGTSDDAWSVYFGNGAQGSLNKSASVYVRCVRAGQ